MSKNVPLLRYQLLNVKACFVEVDDPLASGVTYSFIENSVSTFYLKFKNVPIAKIDLIENRLKQELDSIINGKVAWDSGRMDTVINRRIQEQMSQIENSPHDSVASMVIGDVLYGRYVMHIGFTLLHMILNDIVLASV